MTHSVNRAIKVAGCSTCRAALLGSFAAISGFQIPFTQYQVPLTTRFSFQTRFISDASQQPPLDSKIILSATSNVLKNGEEKGTSAKHTITLNEDLVSSLPWYLQIDKPITNQRPLSERQRIPDLPENSPQILQSLLQHISVDLGLDDLSLLDLRDLDPPPALGANLLMIIGTARSEKHLHVSADRLCRWLRSEYKLRPEADGLLGRNELKLKLRRKNRRAKLLGSENTDEYLDDGVRTGWICVNVGVIKHPENERQEILQKKTFVGFGTRIDGIKIVVQMLVEEKRKEIDLEMLWGGIKKRQLMAKSAGFEEAAEISSEESDARESKAKSSPATQPLPLSAHLISRNSPSTRGFHTSARLNTLQADAITPSQDPNNFGQTLSSPSLTHQEMEYLSMIRAADFGIVKNLPPDFQECSNSFKSHAQSSLKDSLQSLPTEDALIALGNGPEDFSSTPFLSCLQMAISSFPSDAEWAFRVWVYGFARTLGHQSYDLNRLKILFEQLQVSGTTVSKETYLSVIRTALSYGTLDHTDDTSLQARRFVVTIIGDMHERHIPLISADIFITLQESLAAATVYSVDGHDIVNNDPRCFEPVKNNEPVHLASPSSQLNTLMHALDVRIAEESDLIRLLDVYANNYHWPAFWNIWRSVSRNGRPRSASLYAFMFRRVADTKHQSGCVKALRSWIPEMDREEPAVILEGEVLKSIIACLTIADPTFSETKPDLNNISAKGEWVRLWRKCVEAEST